MECCVPLLQLTGETVGEVKAVADMHQRKAEMAKHSDAFIALPGWCKPLPQSVHFLPNIPSQPNQTDALVLSLSHIFAPLSNSEFTVSFSVLHHFFLDALSVSIAYFFDKFKRKQTV